MKILFILRNSAHLFYTESVFNEFLKHGHQLNVLYERYTGEANDRRLMDFKERYQNFHYGRAYWRTDKWKAPLYYSRALLSYRRYLLMENQSLHYRNRYRKFLPTTLKFALSIPLFEGLAHWAIKTNFADRFLRWFDEAAGLDEKIFYQVKDANPDVVLICIGGLRYGSVDVDYLKAAKRLGIPTAALVMTWDSVSSKSLIQIAPDILLVLNELQADEAVAQHHIESSKIRITGAAVFDRWFGDLKISASREEFCKKYDLRPQDPILLYLGSPMSNTQDETWVLEGLRELLDKSEDVRLRKMQIVLRPHPDNAKHYDNLAVRDAVVVPRGGALPGTHELLQVFYDTLAHSFAAVGINTSAMLEAMLAGKPVFTVLLDQYKKTQSEAMHFRKMLLEGAMVSTTNIGELVPALKDILDKKDNCAENRKIFIKKFIRPYGLEVTAASKVVDAVETLVKQK